MSWRGAIPLSRWTPPVGFINGGFLTAIDARTGKTINSFGDSGRTDLRNGLDCDPGRELQTNNPGRIFEDIIITPLPAGNASYDSTPADIHAYDVVFALPKK